MSLMVTAVDKTPFVNDLGEINRDLAALFHCEPARIALGADAASGDNLVVCGLLGGKDVGKSTLINALANTEVSRESLEVSEGTSRPIAYVHEDMQRVVTTRLREIDHHVPVDVATHNADILRNVVLVDLPDFDSEFPDHLRIVRAVAPLLDRAIWVLTPRKIGDRAWVEMFRSVIKDARNVFCVLNKVDELLADGLPPTGKNGSGNAAKDRLAEAFWQDQHEWVASSIETAGCAQSTDRRFLVSAAFNEPDRFVRRTATVWDDPDFATYRPDAPTVEKIAHFACSELDRLREAVLGPVTVEESDEIKRANRACERTVTAARIAEHYELDRTIERLADASSPGYYQRVFNEAIGPEYCQSVGDSLRAHARSDTGLADELLEHRALRWPLLRLVYWPFGWMSRMVGRRIGPASAKGRTTGDVELNLEGQTLTGRVDLMRARILADHALVDKQLHLTSELPDSTTLADQATAGIHGLGPAIEKKLLDTIRGKDRRPSLLGKAALWCVLLWFPLVQPIAEGILEILSQGGTIDTVHGLYKIVAALSAPRLIAGIAIVVAVYVALLAGMYARGLRAVRRARELQDESSPWTQGVEETLTTQVALPLARPFLDRHERLTTLQARLEHVPQG